MTDGNPIIQRFPRYPFRNCKSVDMSKPTSPYKPRRWKGFLSDIKEESCAFKAVLKESAALKEESNRHYQTCSQKSFMSLHRSMKRSPDPSRAVPRLSRPQTRTKEKRKEEANFELDMRVTNQHKWPVRNVTRSSLRVLTPTKLQDYQIERPKDIVCVFGAPLSKHGPELW